MRTVTVRMPDEDFKRLGISSDSISIDELMDILHRDATIQAMMSSYALSRKQGLPELTMEEIDEEVKAVRADAKRDH
jgi:hypothetical protein